MPCFLRRLSILRNVGAIYVLFSVRFRLIIIWRPQINQWQTRYSGTILFGLRSSMLSLTEKHRWNKQTTGTRANWSMQIIWLLCHANSCVLRMLQGGGGQLKRKAEHSIEAVDWMEWLRSMEMLCEWANFSVWSGLRSHCACSRDVWVTHFSAHLWLYSQSQTNRKWNESGIFEQTAEHIWPHVWRQKIFGRVFFLAMCAGGFPLFCHSSASVKGPGVVSWHRITSGPTWSLHRKTARTAFFAHFFGKYITFECSLVC